MANLDLPTAGDVRVEDDDPSFSYSPAGAWTTNSTNPSLHSESSFHLTRSQNGEVSVAFNGTRIWMYGDMSPQHKDFRVVLDYRTPSVLSSYATFWTAQELLYTSPELDSTQHTVLFTNVAEGAAFGVNYIVYRPIRDAVPPQSSTSPVHDEMLVSSTTGTGSPVSLSPATITRGLHGGGAPGEHRWQIVAIVVTALAVLLLVPAALFFRSHCACRKRRASMRPLAVHPPQPPEDPATQERDVKLAMLNSISPPAYGS